MRRGQPTWTSAFDTELLGLYVKGKPLCEYADELNVTERTVRLNMVRLNLEPLPRGRPKDSRDRMPRQSRRRA